MILLSRASWRKVRPSFQLFLESCEVSQAPIGQSHDRMAAPPPSLARSPRPLLQALRGQTPGDPRGELRSAERRGLESLADRNKFATTAVGIKVLNACPGDAEAMSRGET